MSTDKHHQNHSKTHQSEQHSEQHQSNQPHQQRQSLSQKLNQMQQGSSQDYYQLFQDNNSVSSNRCEEGNLSQSEQQDQERFTMQEQSIISLTVNQIDELSIQKMQILANNLQDRIQIQSQEDVEEVQQMQRQKVKSIDPEKCEVKSKYSRTEEVLPAPITVQVFESEITLNLVQLNQVKLSLDSLIELYLSSNNLSSALSEIQQNVRKFHKVILLRESQMFMTVFILQNKDKQSFKQKYHQSFSQLGQFCIPFQKASQFINLKAAIQILQAEREVLSQYNLCIQDLKHVIHKKYRTKYLIRGLNRVRVVVFPFACILEESDLFTYHNEHPRWQKLDQECITYRILADQQTLKKSFDNFKQNVNLVNAMMSILNKSRTLPITSLTSWFQFARSSKYFLKCFLFKDAAKKQAENMATYANAQMMKEVWNLPEHKIFRDVAEFVLPSIQHSERLYVPRTLKEYFNDNGHSKFPSMNIEFLNQYGNDLFKKQPYKQSIRIRINSKYKLVSKYQIIDSKAKNQSQGNGLITHKMENVIKGAMSVLTSSKPVYVPEQLIFHIHGGGFISMSSFIHQLYTRTWAKDLDVPIISVDYGKAPQHPYPESLYDCFEAYMWTVKCFEQVYEASPKRIIILGDSAGGNLALALTNLLIVWKLRKPDGLVLCYPVFSVKTTKYTRSLLGTLEDMILPHTLLKLCALSYANAQGQMPNDQDPLISPLYTPDAILKQYPPMKLFVGSKDPFHDDCCRFTQKMNNVSPGMCYLTILQEFCHGFLQFDIKTHPHHYSRIANEQICETIRKMFKSIEKSTNNQKKN